MLHGSGLREIVNRCLGLKILRFQCLITKMVLVATWASVCNSSNDYAANTIVALTSSRVGNLDLTTAVWAWRLVLLPVVGEGNDSGAVLSDDTHISSHSFGIR